MKNDMKQYDELTYDEKVALLKDALDKWKKNEKPYDNLENKYHVAGWCLTVYYKESNNLELPTTTPAEWQQDIYDIIKTLDV